MSGISPRPWTTVGLVVAAAGVIAVAPIEPPSKAELVIANSAVEIDVTPSTFDYYTQVLARSMQNLGDRVEEYLAAPLPILSAMTESQYRALAEVVGSAENGDVAAVVTAVVNALALPVTTAVNVASTGEPFRLAAGVIVRLAMPIVSGILAAGSTITEVVTSLLGFDVVDAFGALSSLPARIVDGILNGHAGPGADGRFGLLSPTTVAPVTGQLTGPVSFLIDSLQDIGETIASQPPLLDGPASGDSAAGEPVVVDLDDADPDGSPTTVGSATDGGAQVDESHSGSADSDSEIGPGPVAGDAESDDAAGTDSGAGSGAGSGADAGGGNGADIGADGGDETAPNASGADAGGGDTDTDGEPTADRPGSARDAGAGGTADTDTGN